jgi:hypothetical protein
MPRKKYHRLIKLGRENAKKQRKDDVKIEDKMEKKESAEEQEIEITDVQVVQKKQRTKGGCKTTRTRAKFGHHEFPGFEGIKWPCVEEGDKIAFIGGDKIEKNGNIQRSTFEVGDLVFGKYKNGDLFFPGIIHKKFDGKFNVAYIDGDVEEGIDIKKLAKVEGYTSRLICYPILNNQ